VQPVNSLPILQPVQTKTPQIEMAALNPVSETLYEYGVDLISALQSS
jgi:hypothetical protein